MSLILELENITKIFSGVTALENMHITLKKGELHAICGENGAGKSTLMKIITGVHQPTSGNIFIKGEKVILKGPNDAYSKGVAIIFQETSLFPDLTILENMFIGHEPLKKKMGFISEIDYDAMREKADEIFETLNLDLDVDVRVEDLGVAQKQMVEIAKALTYDSDVLILDEPTAALTHKEVKALFEIIKNLQKKGVSMLYISHRLEEIFEMADRVTVIRDGKYINDDLIENVDHDKLVSWMVGREMSSLYPKAEAKIGNEILRVENFKKDKMLKDISITVKKGETVGIAGLAGSGRTELAHSISGLLEIDYGKLFLDGKELKIKNYRHAIENGIIYVSEDRKLNGLVLEMNIRANTVLSILDKITQNCFINFKEKKEIATNYMDVLQIKADSTDFIVENLSGGNQQKVAVAKALAGKPRVLILDEPTRGVDVGSKAEIHKIISELASKGLSIIMISSDLPEIIGMSDRVYIMKEGRIAGELDRADATQENILSIAL